MDIRIDWRVVFFSEEFSKCLKELPVSQLRAVLEEVMRTGLILCVCVCVCVYVCAHVHVCVGEERLQCVTSTSHHRCICASLYIYPCVTETSLSPTYHSVSGGLLDRLCTALQNDTSRGSDFQVYDFMGEHGVELSPAIQLLPTAEGSRRHDPRTSPR